MRLYIVRHAIAVPHGTPGVEEDERPLTDEGARRMRQIVRGLGRLGVELDLIVSSSLPRARQTAEILAQIKGFAGTVENLDAMAPGGPVQEVLELLANRPNHRAVGLVGHEPDLGLLISRILHGGGASVVELRKGAVARIDIEQLTPILRGRLVWLLQPRILRAM